MSQFDSMMAEAVPALAESQFDNAGVAYTTPGHQTFTWDCSLSRIRGDVVQEDGGNIEKVMRTTAVGLTQTLIDYGVTELQRSAKFAALGYSDWSLDLSQSEWGASIVKLELKRYPIAAHRQMESNAAL